MRRREFVTFFGGVATLGLPWKAHSQQRSLPVVGFVHLTSPELTKEYVADFQNGLADIGFRDGFNVAIEYRWGQGRNDNLPRLIGDLVDRKVDVIAVLESRLGALAAKAATPRIPIVFMQGADPVRIGLVESLSHPGGNLTGINLFLAEVAAKRLDLLHELLPGAKSIGYLRNPSNPIFAESETEVQAAARTLGITLKFLNVSSLSDIDTQFAEFDEQHVDALFVSSDGFLLSHSEEIAELASRYRVPAIYGWRHAVAVGGLMSYGTYFPDAWRQAGVYVGRILKGNEPGDLPVQQVTKIELLVNRKTADALGLTVPPSLIARADEVIE